MISSSIQLAEKYDYLDEKFRKAYKWLRETDLARTPAGSYPIDGDTVVASVQEYDTTPATQNVFETHDAHFDIQYVISGKEYFGVCPRKGLRLKEDMPARDMKTYEEPARSSAVLLEAGDLIIVPPEDAHKPRCAVDAPEFVRKVVVKVRV